MAIEFVLAVVPVSDIGRAREWYGQLFGREPDNNPMESLIEWHITDNGWVQVTHQSERAGNAYLNLAVSDLDQHIAELTERGLKPGAVQPVNKGVLLSPIDDPDGNTITLIGNFRVKY